MIGSAPGKLFLTGEYAVLEGADALLIPVPARATAAISEPAAGSDARVVTFTTHAVSQPTATAVLSEPLLAAVVTELGCAEQLEGRELRLDTSSFFHGDQKLGFGSSAALTVALVRLFQPDLDRETLLAKAQACHLRFQGGKGSGADIALSVMDQPIRFVRGQSPEVVALPPDLHMLAIWTGNAASTTDYISAMKRWRNSHPAAFETRMTELKSLAIGAAAGLVAGAEAFLEAVAAYNVSLAALSEESGMGFYSKPHVALRNEVESAHLTYKPSGAGGGDFGIAFGTDRNALLALQERLTREGRYTVYLTEQ